MTLLLGPQIPAVATWALTFAALATVAAAETRARLRAEAPVG